MIIRKAIPALLLATCLPAIVLAAPTPTQASSQDAALNGPGFGPEEATPPTPDAAPMHGPNAHNNRYHGFKGPMHNKGVYGSDRCPGFKGPNGPVERMAGIKLTPKQNEGMRKILGDQAQANFKIKQKYFDKLPDADKKAMLDELNQNREDSMKKMRALLTPEQQKQMDERKQQQEQRMKEWQEFQQWKAQKAAAK